jgi:hypothetical protein
MSKFLLGQHWFRETNSVLDSRFWELLGDVVSPTNSPSSSVNTRPIKTWLVPLLSRIPIAPIAISFLNLISLLDSVSRQQLAQSVCRSLLILWPLGVPKLGSDTLSDCFSAVLGIFKECESNERLAHVGLFMTSSFRTSLANASNKKKVCLKEFIRLHVA